MASDFRKKITQKLSYILMFGAASLVISFIIASSIITATSGENFTVGLLFENITNGKSTFWGLAIFAILVLFVVLSAPNEKNVKLKGKDKMENQRFLKTDELDKRFKNCYYHDFVLH